MTLKIKKLIFFLFLGINLLPHHVHAIICREILGLEKFQSLPAAQFFPATKGTVHVLEKPLDARLLINENSWSLFPEGPQALEIDVGAEVLAQLPEGLFLEEEYTGNIYFLKGTQQSLIVYNTERTPNDNKLKPDFDHPVAFKDFILDHSYFLENKKNTGHFRIIGNAPNGAIYATTQAYYNRTTWVQGSRRPFKFDHLDAMSFIFLLPQD